jgi:hypothetical protein
MGRIATIQPFVKGECLLIILKVLLDALYGPHLHCYKPVRTYLTAFKLLPR